MPPDKLLPELAAGQKVIRESLSDAFVLLEHHAYPIALAGLTLFYGLERAAKLSRRRHGRADTREVPEVATSVLVALLAGGVILNVLKEELPEERQSRFIPFLLGSSLVFRAPPGNVAMQIAQDSFKRSSTTRSMEIRVEQAHGKVRLSHFSRMLS